MAKKYQHREKMKKGQNYFIYCPSWPVATAFLPRRQHHSISRPNGKQYHSTVHCEERPPAQYLKHQPIEIRTSEYANDYVIHIHLHMPFTCLPGSADPEVTLVSGFDDLMTIRESPLGMLGGRYIAELEASSLYTLLPHCRYSLLLLLSLLIET